MDLVALGCALGSGLAMSLVPSIFRRQGPAHERQMGLQIGGNLMAGAACAAPVLALGLPLGGKLFLLLAVLTGLGNALNGYTYLSVVLHRGPVSISWAVVYTSAVLVAVAGWLFLREPVRLWHPWGLLCFLGCLAVMAAAARRTAAKGAGELAPKKGYWFWLAVALLAGAANGFLMKLKDQAPPVGAHLSFLAAGFIAATAALALASGARGPRPACDWKTWKLSAAYAGCALLGLLLILKGLETADVSVLLPVQAGAAILFGSLWAFLGGERPSRLAFAGAALAVLSIILINLGGRPLWGGR